MTLLAVGCLALAGWLLPSRDPRSRVAGTSGGQPPSSGGARRRTPVVESVGVRLAFSVTALAVAGLALGGLLGALLSVPLGIATASWLGRLETTGAVRIRHQIERDLPIVVDMLAGCAAAGRPPQAVLGVVAAAVVGSPLGDRLEEVDVRIALGSDPIAEWARWADDPALGRLGTALARSADSGAPIAARLSRLSDDLRRDRRTQTQLRARSVGVRAAGPLAGCFLPSFVLIGVVPTVVGSFDRLLG